MWILGEEQGQGRLSWQLSKDTHPPLASVSPRGQMPATMQKSCNRGEDKKSVLYGLREYLNPSGRTLVGREYQVSSSAGA